MLMGFAHVQSIGVPVNSPATSYVATYAGAVTATNLLVGMITWQSGTATATVADNVNGAWTAVAGSLATNTTTGVRTQTFYKANTGAGTPTVTATITASVNGGIDILEYSGGANAVDSSNAAFSNSSSVPTLSLTTLSDHTLIVAHAEVAAATDQGAAYVNRLNTNDNCTEDDVDATPTGATTVNFSATNANWVVSATAFKISGGTDATVTGVVADSIGSAPGAGVTVSAGTDTLGYANGALGAPWLAWAAADGVASLTVTSGRVAMTPGATGTLGDASYPVAIGPDSFVEVVLPSSLPNSVEFGAGLRLTAHSAAANGYIASVTTSGGGSLFGLYKGSGLSFLAQSSSYTASTVDAFRLSAVGSTIKGYFRVSGVWTEVVSTTDSTYTSAGYPGFYIFDPSAIGGQVDSVSWGAPAVNSTVTAVPALALGSAPIATVTGTGSATVTAVPATATGDNPVAVINAGATIAGAVALGLGSGPPANSLLSAVVGAPAVEALGSAPVATVTSAGNATVAGVPATALGSAAIPALNAGSVISAVPAVALGSAPASSLSLGWTVAGVVALATGQAPRPSISPAPAGASGSLVSVATTFAEDSA